MNRREYRIVALCARRATETGSGLSVWFTSTTLIDAVSPKLITCDQSNPGEICKRKHVACVLEEARRRRADHERENDLQIVLAEAEQCICVRTDENKKYTHIL
jgi:hypothetical protein